METYDQLYDISKSAKELSEIYNMSPWKIYELRSRLNILVPRGSKPGKAKPEKFSRKWIVCECCGIKFEVVKSSKRRFCSLSCVSKSNDRSYMQTEKYRNTLIKDSTPEYRRYRNRVSKLTEKVYLENIDILNPNKHVRTLCGIEGGYQLDHKQSVKKCFILGITPEQVSVLENLQLLPWKENLLKR